MVKNSKNRVEKQVGKKVNTSIIIIIVIIVLALGLFWIMRGVATGEAFKHYRGGIIKISSPRAREDVTDISKFAVCGNGVLEGREWCDDGNRIDTDACTNQCRDAVCGDRVVRSGVEQCDDGNTISGDGCSSACQRERIVECNNGVREGAEECDDGNRFDDDDCTTECLRVICGNNRREGREECDLGNDGNPQDPPGTVASSTCTELCRIARCGDFILTQGLQYHEECEDHNQFNTDACTNQCRSARCGDGFVQAGVEACDDGNTRDGDGCNSRCQRW